MNKQIICSAIIAVLFIGCAKAPEPKNAFKSKKISINNSLLEKTRLFCAKR